MKASMVPITAEMVERMAALSGLRLTEEEIERFRGQIAVIVSYFDQLGEVDTTGVDPTYAVHLLSLPLREDEPIPSLPQDEVLKNAPAHRLGFFSVPKVIP